jgi:hypothetical protein
MIPKKDSLFAAWALNFAAVITAAPADFGLLAGDAITITAAANAFDTAYTAATDPGTRNAVTVAAKNVARSNAEFVIRPYAVAISLSRVVSDANKALAGVTIRNTVPSPVPAPVDAPLLAIQKAIPGVVDISYRVPGSTSKAKPDGCIGVEVWVASGVAAAVSPSQTSYAFTATKAPTKLDIAPANVGSTMTVFARYTTRSGPGGKAQVGPWSLPLVFVGM